MRYFIFGILFCFAACKNKDTSTSTSSADTVATQTDSVNTGTAPVVNSTPALVEYQHQLYVLPIEQTSMRTALELFKNKFSKQDPAENDQALKIFLAFQRQLINILNDTLMASADYAKIDSFIESDSAANSEEAKVYEKNLNANALTLASEEGSAYLKLQPELVKDYFYAALSPAGQEYFPLFMREVNENALTDGGLAISVTALADRLGDWNNFIIHHPQSIFYENAFNERRFCRYTLLSGMDNTPAFDYESKKLDKEFLQAYQHYLHKYPPTEDATILREYLALLSKSDFKKNENVEAFQQKYSGN